MALKPAVEGQALFVAHAARVAERARALRAAAPLRCVVRAAVAAGHAPALLVACTQLQVNHTEFIMLRRQRHAATVHPHHAVRLAFESVPE